MDGDQRHRALQIAATTVGCGVQQGYYNLELLAVPNGSAATDLYAGAINLYKCSINSANPTCNTAGLHQPDACLRMHPDRGAWPTCIPLSMRWRT